MRLYLHVSASAQGARRKPETVFENSGHMSSSFMFYEGAGPELVHSVS